MSSKKNSHTAASGAVESDTETVNRYKIKAALSDNNVNAFQAVLQNLMSEMHNLSHGILTLQIHFREGNLYRYTINRETSFLCGKGE